jgi:uncharacterized protein YhbP (UPF0306 family)
MTKFDWPKHLKAALEATPFMALATRGPEGMWNHAVYFAYDPQLNFYFISQPGSRHMQNLKKYKEVALAIFNTGQSPTEHVVGLQVRGHARIVPDVEVHEAHQIYYARSPDVPGIPNYLNAYLGESAPWKIVKVTPDEIGYFDTRHFGDARQTVPDGTHLERA